MLLVGTAGVKPEDIPWIEEDGVAGLPWAPEAEVRILRVPPFAQGIARRAVEEYVLEQGGDIVTNQRLDEAIRKLLPTHMQLIMGIGSAEEMALAELKAEEQLRTTKVQGRDVDPEPPGEIEVRCPVTGAVSRRARTAKDPIVWTEEAWERLQRVPLIARPLARNTVERFARNHGIWRVTTAVMDENKQAMIEADEFDAETMMVMFQELRAKQIRAGAEKGTGELSSEMRRFIEEAKAAGITRCPVRDLEAKMSACPVDFSVATPEEAKSAVELLLEQQGGAS